MQLAGRNIFNEPDIIYSNVEQPRAEVHHLRLDVEPRSEGYILMTRIFVAAAALLSLHLRGDGSARRRAHRSVAAPAERRHLGLRSRPRHRRGRAGWLHLLLVHQSAREIRFQRQAGGHGGRLDQVISATSISIRPTASFTARWNTRGEAFYIAVIDARQLDRVEVSRPARRRFFARSIFRK